MENLISHLDADSVSLWGAVFIGLFLARGSTKTRKLGLLHFAIMPS